MATEYKIRAIAERAGAMRTPRGLFDGPNESSGRGDTADMSRMKRRATMSCVLSAVAVVLVATCTISAQSGAPQWTTPAPEEIDAIFPDVDALYVDLHRTPEL